MINISIHLKKNSKITSENRSYSGLNPFCSSEIKLDNDEVTIFHPNKKFRLVSESALTDVLYDFAERVLDTKDSKELNELVSSTLTELE